MQRIGGLLLAVILAGPLTAQTRPLDPTVINNLWPERELTPAESELKVAVLVLRDSLYQVDAAVERVERGRRGDASPAVLRSAGLALVGECIRGDRAAGRMQTHAAGLSTNNTRWGDGSLVNYRDALSALRRELTACQQKARAAADGKNADPDRLVAAAGTTRTAVREYERALRGLLQTLKIKVDPKGAELGRPS